MADGIVTKTKPAERTVGQRTPEPFPTARPRLRLDLGNTFAALKHPNYRLWFMGQLASLVGTWMQSTAQAFLVFQLTQSEAYLGFVGFAAGVPTWLLMLYGGVVADRMPRRTMLLLTQTAMMVLAFILAALTFANLVQPWHIILLAFLLGVANAFDAPARQAFVVELVEREDLTNAIALNSTMFQSATVVGPAVAGITYALFGPAWCFTINGISFLAVIAALLRMQLQPMQVRRRATSGLNDMAEGLRYVWRHSTIRTLIAIVGLVSLFGMAYATLFPAWAVLILKGGADVNGLLQSARGLGALLGALMIASMGRFRFKGRLLTLGTLFFPITLIVFSFISWLPLSLIVLIAVGWGFMIVFNMANTLVQTQVSDELRGRVMGVYSFTFFGFMPLGALWAGAMAQWLNPPLAVILGGVVSFAFAVGLFLFVPTIRQLE